MKIEGGNVKIYIGEIIEEDEWDEKIGPNPKPGVTDLRGWDRKLLNRYKAKYNSYIKQCQFCAFGPCDLSMGRRGACGITLDKQMARENLFLTITGAAAHTAHARHGLHTLIKKFGRNTPLDVVMNSEVQAPWVHLVMGMKPKTLGDLEKALDYVEEQLTHLLSSLHMGQESSDFDFNSKALHAGMVDHLGMEIADISQIAALNFPKGEPKPEFVDIGFGTVDKEKPVVLCIGHNVSTGTEIIDYAAENNKDVEIAGICCTAFDLGRYNKRTKIIGQLSYQLPFVRSGIADVIVLDEQCIRVDTAENAERLGIPVIATSDKNVGGFPNMSEEDADKIVQMLISGEIKGVYITDLEKAGEVAVKTAIEIHKRGKKKLDISIEDAKGCVSCGLCTQACPVGNDVKRIVSSINYHYNKVELKYKPIKKKESIDISKEIAECIQCSLCSKNCPNDIDVCSIIKDLKEGKDIDKKLIASCISCGLCYQNCPKDINIPEIFSELKGEDRKDEIIEPLNKDEVVDALGECLFCGRCESWCPQGIPLVSIFSKIYKERFENDKARINPGRGAIQDVEIREVGAPIVFGEIPGIIAPVGCSLWPNGGKELGEIIEEFLKRNYIVVTSGCSAMALATDYSGTHNLYEKYGGEFNGGNLINVGSCVANAHITGAAMKVAHIFARRPLRANFEEIADYILNRVGAVGLVWGTMSQKAVSIGAGVMRLGIPVIWGPSGKKYRKELLSDENTDWSVFDTRGKGRYDVGPVPEHLSYVAETKEEVMTLIPKLCMRASDGIKGRQIKLAHYIDIYEKTYNKLPDDIHKFVRTEADIPLTEKDRLMEILKEKGWEPVEKIPDPTLLKRLSGERGIG